jgi:mercuric ion transport protein
VAIGSVIGAMAASACCVLPFVLFSLGIGGAWMGNLTAMAPYKPFFVILTAGLIGYGYYLRRRSETRTCESCIRPSSKLTSLAFWAAAILLALALIFPYAASVLLNV